MNRLDISKLSEIPAIKAAIALANAETEKKDAASRMAVLNQIDEAQTALTDMLKTDSKFAAQIEKLDVQKADLVKARTQHEYKLQAQQSSLRELERTLDREHGSATVAGIENVLHSRAHIFRARAQAERALKQRRQNRMGGFIEDREAQARASVLDALAIACDKARLEIASLRRAPIAPQEIHRRLEAVMAPIGITINTEVVPAQGWVVTGWAPGLVPSRVMSETA